MNRDSAAPIGRTEIACVIAGILCAAHALIVAGKAKERRGPGKSADRIWSYFHCQECVECGGVGSKSAVRSPTCGAGVSVPEVWAGLLRLATCRGYGKEYPQYLGAWLDFWGEFPICSSKRVAALVARLSTSNSGELPMRRNTIGFRHIVEGTLKIIEGNSLQAARREYILAAMMRFLDEAEKGSSFDHDRAWVISPSDSDALDSYSFVESYLADSNDLDESLLAAKETIELIKMNREAGPDKIKKAVQFLRSLLERLRTERRIHQEQSWGHRFATVGN
jgi:hypothetical protein